MASADAEKGLAMKSIQCESERIRKDGQTRLGGQRWRCNACGRRFTARSTSAFSHHGFPDDVMPWRSAGTSATALRAVFPDAEYQTSKYLDNGIKRDHGHLKQRLYAMRGFTQPTSADVIVRAHALVRKLRNGFSSLTVAAPVHLRLAAAWPQLACAI